MSWADVSKVVSTNVKQRSEKYPEGPFPDSDVTSLGCFILFSNNYATDFKTESKL